jgi:hypothetical protein
MLGGMVMLQLMRMLLVGMLALWMRLVGMRLMLRRMAMACRVLARMSWLVVIVTCHTLRGAPRPALRASFAAGRYFGRHGPWQVSVELLAPTRRKWQLRL